MSHLQPINPERIHSRMQKMFALNYKNNNKQTQKSITSFIRDARVIATLCMKKCLNQTKRAIFYGNTSKSFWDSFGRFRTHQDLDTVSSCEFYVINYSLELKYLILIKNNYKNVL